MSNRAQVITQLDWREQYPQYSPQSETSTTSPHFDRAEDFSSIESSIPESHFGGLSHLGHRKSLAQLGIREENPNHAIAPLLDPGSGIYEQQPVNEHALDVPGLEEPIDSPSASAQRGSLSPVVQPKREYSADQEEDLTQAGMKEGDEEDYDDDDEMLEPDDGSRTPRTEAERRAERRKMKRFRLTHQQTRFLMSEFAKQAHPDAAHRDSLSQQIPGLSPRQVQVWFQNRRAKIKRLTADDRERMLKMRAVPDDFDNIQALHSPYGAVHGTGTPLPSPVDYASSYGEPGMMRPLAVDPVHRQEGGERQVSQTGLSPSFGHIGFGPSGSMNTPDVLSPLSLNSSDRFYGSHLSSPLSAGSQGPNASNRQNSKDNYSMHSQPHSSRPLQPLQLRETMSRSRSQSLQSPLRSSMSWKGDALNYAEYSAALTSPTFSARQQSQYQPEQSSTSPATSQNYDVNAYTNPNVQPSSRQMAYPTPQSSSIQSSAIGASRLRSSSSAFTPDIDMRSQYRNATSQHTNPTGAPPSAHGTPSDGVFAATAGFASAPLKAPSDFRLPRTPTDLGPRDYNLGQLSAPMAPPQDFVNAYNHIVGPRRESAGERALNMQQTQQQSNEGNLQERQTQNVDFLRSENYGNRSDHNRKRTFSMPISFDGS